MRDDRVMVLNEVQLRSSRAREVHSLALQRGKLASLEMQRIIDGVEGVLWAVAKAPMVRRLDPNPARVISPASSHNCPS